LDIFHAFFPIRYLDPLPVPFPIPNEAR
jgi:hypothetical protein